MQDPRSDKKSIRKAYYDAMRDCHPDSNNTVEATEFATFLNEIYEVSPHHGVDLLIPDAMQIPVKNFDKNSFILGFHAHWSMPH